LIKISPFSLYFNSQRLTIAGVDDFCNHQSNFKKYEKICAIMGSILMSGMLMFTSCKKNDDMQPTQSLYLRLGGNTAISAVIDQFIANVASDTRINAFLQMQLLIQLV
jgi:hypothetical protein